MGTSSGGGGQGYGSGAGGWNPQIMPGQGGNNGGSFENGATGGLQNLGGTPFWQPWEGWNMKLGTSPTAAGNDAQAQASIPGSTPGLYSQMAKFFNQPMYTNPNQYGRYNWATNMQGGGVPSPFGQYAQQSAQYNPLQFPQMPSAGGQIGPQGASQAPGGGGVDNLGRPAPFTRMDGKFSTARGRPDMNGHITDFSSFSGVVTGPDGKPVSSSDPEYHRLANAYGNQLGRAGASPEELAAMDTFDRDKVLALGPGFANPKAYAHALAGTTSKFGRANDGKYYGKK